ncbi:hypothetical protein A0H81_14446 [Grifola frondosa]|uniref:Uncharacterized protein n=1 Tax=Grifola frondosa TaxID=5627 RepID=A0A1C7LM71_GRIFR|nr:hypothetical protein A0H81_14446 [Grifola frondosa]
MSQTSRQAVTSLHVQQVFKLSRTAVASYERQQVLDRQQCAVPRSPSTTLGSITMKQRNPAYDNEKEVGRGIRNSGVPRSEIFLTSKLWLNFGHASLQRPALMTSSFYVHEYTYTCTFSPHLRNTSLQTERGEAGVRLLDELIGCHILPSPDAATQSTHQPKPPRTMGHALDVDQIRIAGKESIEALQQDTNPFVVGP